MLASTRDGVSGVSLTLGIVRDTKKLRRSLRTKHTTSVREEAKRGWPNSTISQQREHVSEKVARKSYTD